jgi:hypothetical protein
MTPATFHEKLTSVLRDVARGATADLTEDVVAYWNGERVVYCFLRDDDSNQIGEEFDLDDYLWEKWRLRLEAWMEQPVFTVRPEVHDRCKDEPPHGTDR